MHEFGPTHLHLWGTSGHLRGAVGLPSTSPRAAQALRWRRMTTASRASGRVAPRVGRPWPTGAAGPATHGGTRAAGEQLLHGKPSSEETAAPRKPERREPPPASTGGGLGGRFRTSPLSNIPECAASTSAAARPARFCGSSVDLPPSCWRRPVGTGRSPTRRDALLVSYPVLGEKARRWSPAPSTAPSSWGSAPGSPCSRPGCCPCARRPG